MTLAQIFEPIRQDLEQVEREFARHVESHVALIPEIGRYIQDAGGKRVRPAVLLMAARLAGYTGKRAVLYAAVVEFIHTATLVHDDIVDDSDLRRGRQAVHSKWGNDVTVLLGDYLYIKSMALALTEDSLDIVRILCDVTLRMIEGELFQLSKNGDIGLSERRPLRDPPAEDRRPLRRMRGDWRQLGERRRGAAGRRSATTVSTSAWPSSWWTTCWT